MQKNLWGDKKIKKMNQTGKVKESNAEQYLRLIKDMLDDKTFSKSKEYLESIKNQIQSQNRITPAQMKAINNIYIKFSERS